jgi:hypothetical protein
MLELLDTLSNIGVLGVPGVPARFSAGFSGTPRTTAGVPGVPVGVPKRPEHLAEHPEHQPEHRATALKALENIEEHREHPEHLKKEDGALEWPDALAAIDASRPPAGFDPDRWRCLLTDARWLCRNHGQAAAALGWTASDLFGIDPLSGWGGLADRLEGARNLVLTDRIAHWRGADLEGWLWRCTLTAKPVLWEA